MDILYISKRLAEICDEYSIIELRDDTEELRFSNNTMDIFNRWFDSGIKIFASRGKKIAEASFNSVNLNYDYIIDRIKRMLSISPDYISYNGINPEKNDYNMEITNFERRDIYDISQQLIDASLKNGAERSAGVIYQSYETVHVKTPYNDEKFSRPGMEIVLRSFKGNLSGQENYHFGPGSIKNIDPYSMVNAAVLPLQSQYDNLDIPEGKYDVIMSPNVIGNLLSYSSGFFSFFNIESGSSPFKNMLDKNVASGYVNLSDEPANINGIGFNPVDDEGTLTKNLEIIKNGTLKTYLHSYTTAMEAGTKTTGNAGIIYPHAWQLHMHGGNNKFDDIINSVDHGIFINNAWYTRFQDEENGIFSTVPRDGVFLINNGKISKAMGGIRISDSIPNILKNIKKVSSEEKYVKWWDEISPSIMPYVLAEDVNITKGF
ncbi:TldD/PmbA family protein [Acidiplasma sp.]|uniref:TldD/PmbA family protein n=1 Tax=Acidiplasma sp. TaxID=1872114 RepID=UPI0025888B17|nr:TldD/PmbA family protein [Acidiplasma sp.]